MIIRDKLAADNTVHRRFNYSLALTCCFPGFNRVAAAAFKTVAPRSLTLVSVRRRGERCQHSIGSLPLTKLTENNLIPFFPHLRDQRLARIDNASKPGIQDGGGELSVHLSEEKSGDVPDFDIFEWAKRLHDMLSGYAHGAEA
jgi:hypothetical protein